MGSGPGNSEPATGTPSEPSARERLDSWKEIAAYLKRDVRTLYRWEKEEGLPVRRHTHGKRGSVYAYAHELDAWWNNRRPRLEQEEEAASRWKWRLEQLFQRVEMLVALAVLLVFFLALALSRWANAPQRVETQKRHSPFPTVTFDGTRPQGELSGGVSGDLNGDGRDDVVFSAGEAREIYVLFGPLHHPAGGELPEVASVVLTTAMKGSLYAAQAEDFNGDGIADLLVSQIFVEPESLSNPCRSYLIWGRRTWPKTLTLPEAADVVIQPPAHHDWRLGGGHFSGPSDVSGDGIADVILSASEYTFEDRKSSGALFVLFGRKRWPKEVDVLSGADLAIVGSRTGEGLGGPCVTGDFNGDSLPDIAAFANEGMLWNLLNGKGKVYVFFGRKTWPRRLDAQADFDLRIEGLRPKATWVSLLLADVNGDRRDDLVAGWPEFRDAPEHPGQVHIWFGSDRLRGAVGAEAPDVVVTGHSPGAQLGHALAGTDVDGDGLQDLQISQPGRGEVWLLYGSREWKRQGRLEDFPAVLVHEGERGAGLRRIGIGDWDGDGLREMAFASPEAGVGARLRAGLAWVMKPYLPVRVDVRPEMEPNTILEGQGVSAVRVYGFSRSTADQLDPASLRLAGAQPFRSVSQDYNGDGVPDWQAYFENTSLHVTAAMKQVAVTGRSRSGLPVGGTDSVVIFRGEPQAAKSGEASKRTR
jgi:hypothetical protein